MFCLTAIAFSRAATAVLLTAIYIVLFVIMKTLHGFRKKDYFVVCLRVARALFRCRAVIIVIWPDFLFSLLGKDLTLTGRTGIWSRGDRFDRQAPAARLWLPGVLAWPRRRILSRDSRGFVGSGAGAERVS